MLRKMMPNLALLLLVSCVAAVGTAQQNDRYIEVIGSGVASESPDMLVASGKLVANGDSVKQAIKVFGENKNKFESVINPMDFPDVKVKYEKLDLGLNLSEDMDFMMVAGQQPVAPEPGYVMNQEVTLSMPLPPDTPEKSKFAMMSKLIDTAQSNGVSFGPSINPMMGYSYESSALISGTYSDMDKLAELAEKRAFENAKEQAARLANLSGAKIGRVISIKASADSEEINTIQEVYGYMGEYSNNDVDSIKVSKQLKIRFELISH